jgi:hypothetical protein
VEFARIPSPQVIPLRPNQFLSVEDALGKGHVGHCPRIETGKLPLGESGETNTLVYQYILSA